MLRDGFILPAETLHRVWEGLVKAVLWHLTDCSARYASRFREGFYALSLVRSLAAAGETLADYTRHVRQIVRAFAGFDPGSSIAGAEGTIHPPRPTDPEPGRAHPPSLPSVLATAIAQVSWRRLRASRQHSAWERRSVVRLFRRLAQERERDAGVTSERLALLAEDLHRVLFFASQNFQVRLRRLNHRFEALAARLLQELNLPPMDLHVRPSPAVAAATADTLPEALGNPGLPPKRVRARSKPRRPRVKRPEDWEHRRGVWSPRTHSWQSFDDLEGLSRATPLDPAGTATPGGAPQGGAPPSTQARVPVPPPQAELDNPESFRDLVARALGPNPALKKGQADSTPAGLADALWTRLETARLQAEAEREAFAALLNDYRASLVARDPGPGVGSSGSGVGDSGIGARGSEFSRPESGVPGSGSAVPQPESPGNVEANPESPTPNPESPAPIPESPAPNPGPDLTALATALVLLLRGTDADPRIEAGRRLDAEILRFRTQIWIYLMPVTRGVARSAIAMLKPDPPSDCGLLPKFLKLRHARDPRRRALAEFYIDQEERRNTECNRWQPVIESGDIGRLLSEDEANPGRGAWGLVQQIAGI